MLPEDICCTVIKTIVFTVNNTWYGNLTKIIFQFWVNIYSIKKWRVSEDRKAHKKGVKPHSLFMTEPYIVV